MNGIELVKMLEQYLNIPDNLKLLAMLWLKKEKRVIIQY